MIVRDKWTEIDFDKMGWHDSRLYKINFPNEECKFILFIDYIFKWEKNGNNFKFWVSPCELIFENVTNLKINISFKDEVGLDIEEIERIKLGLTPNKLMYDWKYIIKTDKGDIELISTGFVMNLISQPILTSSLSLNDNGTD